jgi:CRP-like cAMP-binding protein
VTRQRPWPDANLLLETPFFTAFGASERRELLARMSRRRFRRGDVLFYEYARAEALFLISTGSARLSRTAREHTIVVSEERGPCALVTIGLFDGGCNSVTATAASDGIAYLLDRPEFERICSENPRAATVLLNLCSRRVRQTIALVDALAFSSVRQRAARWIVNMLASSGGNQVVLPGSQSQVAGCIGSVREVLMRRLKEFQREGIIEVRRRTVVVHDVPRLEQAAGIPLDAGAARG